MHTELKPGNARKEISLKIWGVDEGIILIWGLRSKCVSVDWILLA
jgi:hypothetical protein